MNKGLMFLIFALLFISLEPSLVFAAEVLIDDTFLDKAKINPLQTTAEVDTAKGWVTLTRKGLGNALALYEKNYNVTVVNGQSIDTYQFNGSAMEKNSSLSIANFSACPRSVSTQTEGKYVVLHGASGKVATYQYNGSAMIENPFLSVNGLTNPISIAALWDSEGYGVLENNNVNWYSYDGDEMVLNTALSVDLGENSNPVSFDIMGAGLEYAVIDKSGNKIKYYSFDGTSLVLNPLFSILTPDELINPKSISIYSEGASFVVLDDVSVKAYSFDGSKMVNNQALSVTGLRKPLSVAVKPGSYDYSVLQLDENDLPFIRYFVFNGSEMEEIPELRITGLDHIPYDNDQILMGKEMAAANAVSGLRIIADVDLPEGTSITWEVTVDGVLWKKAVNNGDAVKFTTMGTKPNYRAILHTDNPQISPKILRVQLINSSLWLGNYKITYIAGPEIPDNPVLPTSQQVRVWAGYNVTFQIDSRGCAESVQAETEFLDSKISLNSFQETITAIFPPDQYNNTWVGTFYIPGDIPKNTLLDIFFTANKESEYVYVSYPDFAMIYGSAFENHRIHLTH